MDRYVTVCRVGAIKDGQAAAFPIGGTIIAVFHRGGEYFAMNDMCPHMGASLAEGYVADGTVTCPWHAWRFSLHDGTWCENPSVNTETYAVRVVGDEIQVALPAERSSGEGSNEHSLDPFSRDDTADAEGKSGSPG